MANLNDVFADFKDLSPSDQIELRKKIEEFFSDNESDWDECFSEESEEVEDYLTNDEIPEQYRTFVRNLCRAGFEEDLRLSYKGRYFYNGPAVDCSHASLQDVLRHAKVKCTWDSMGLGLIVYPCE